MLWRGLSALEGSVIGSSAAMGTAKSLRGSDEWSIEGKVERNLLIGMGNLTVRKNNWKT
jgi:hypothetical protein